MNRNNPNDRSHRDRHQGDTSRQYERFSDSDSNYGDDDRLYGQESEGGSRGQFERDSYGLNRGGWAGDRGRGGHDQQPESVRRNSGFSGQADGYLARGYGNSPSANNEGRGFDSFTSSDFGGRDFSGQSQNYGAGRSLSDSYSPYGGANYGAGTSGGSYGRSSGGGGGYAGGPGSSLRSGRSIPDDQNERGFFERAGDEVASWFGDEDAARRREQDHSGRGPVNYTRSDQRILEDACDRLTIDRGVDASAVQVTVQEGEVTLDGTVPTRQQKRRAEDCIDSLSGVKHVQNNLRVQQTSDANRSNTSGQSSSNQTAGESL